MKFRPIISRKNITNEIYLLFIIIQLNMNKRNIFFFAFVILLSFTLWINPGDQANPSIASRILTLTTFNTNPVRTSTVIKYCAGLDRNNLVDSTDTSTADSYKSQLAAQFSVDGNQLINTAISGDTSGAMTKAQSQAQAYGMFVGAFVLGLVIILFIWAFLLCCCCCPGCCPSKCCQKADNQQYTKCQLYWPSVFLILCLLLIIITCAIGISKASTLKKGIDATSCSISIFMDDLINGNVSSSGTTFWMGLSTLSTQLGNLNTNVGDIVGNLTLMSSSDATMGGYLTHAQTARDDCQMIPKGLLTNVSATIQYTVPFNTAYSGGKSKINSVVVDRVGDASKPTSISGSLYTIASQLYDALDTIATNSQTVKTGLSGFAGNIGTLQTTLNDFSNQITDYDSSVGDILSLTSTPSSMGTLVLQAFYGASLGLAVFSLIGVVLMTFCDKYKCRYLMYFACIFMFFIAIVGFLLATIFSIIIPFYYWGCEWTSTTIGSQSGFSNNVQNFISDADTRSYIQTCVAGGTGDLMTAIGTATGVDVSSLNSLSTSLTEANTFDATAYTNELTTATSGIQTIINNFQSGQVPDITDSTNVGFLNTASQPSNFNGTCSSDLMLDSWVYSNLNLSYISCKVSGGHTVVSGDCALRANVQAAPTGNCQGCVDSHVIFNDIYDGLTQGDLASDLALRYTACTSSNFPLYMGNIWDNYYYFKIPIMKGIKTRTTAALTSISTVITDLTSINTLFNNVITNLDTVVSGVTDPTYGLVAGLNCVLIGEDIKLFVSTLCVSNFNTFYLTRLIMGISSFGILFALCCIVCSGVRHFKHSERKDKIAPSFGGKNSFQDTQAVFRN